MLVEFPIFSKVIPERGGRLSFLVCVLSNDVDYGIDHIFFLLLLIVNIAVIIGIIDGEIGIDPYFDIAVLIDTNLVFLN